MVVDSFCDSWSFITRFISIWVHNPYTTHLTIKISQLFVQTTPKASMSTESLRQGTKNPKIAQLQQQRYNNTLGHYFS